MKIKNHLLAGLTLLSPLALQSCFDNDYDLSDIDTTVRLNTTDLVVPLNLDVITLGQVLEIEEDDAIQTYVDPVTGQEIYAIKKGGTFNADEIDVAKFTVSKPKINPTSSKLDLITTDLPLGVTGSYPIISTSAASFDSKATDVDKSIYEIKRVDVITKFTTVLRLKDQNNKVLAKNILENLTFQGIKLQFPKEIVGNYKDKSIDDNGILDLSDETFTPNTKGELSLEINVTAIDLTRGDGKIALNDKHELIFAGDINVIEGDAYIKNVLANELPSTVNFDLEPQIQAIEVTNFTGKLEYKVEDFNVEPIDLSDLPDFLNQQGTNISLKNPQIYLAVTNPLDEYEVYFQSGFELTTMRGKDSQTYTLDGGTFKTQDLTDGEHLFVFAPQNPKDVQGYYYEGYEKADFYKFSGLKNMLTVYDKDGNILGMPTKINVNAVDPIMPAQDVEDFQLGVKLKKVTGRYDFFAPLQLDESYITYTDTIDGWNDEDVDGLTLEKVTVSFDATTTVPYNVELYIIPITLDAKEIPGVKYSKATLTPNAQDEHVELSITGKIEHLDGIKIKAIVEAGDDADIMAPDMELHVKNSKLTVTGHYDKEL